MVRRGSTVRVRQRALQKPRSQGFFVRIDLQDRQRVVGMEPLYGAFRSKARVFGRILHKRRMWADNETRIDLLGFDFLVDELLVIPRRVRAQLPRPASERPRSRSSRRTRTGAATASHCSIPTASRSCSSPWPGPKSATAADYGRLACGPCGAGGLLAPSPALRLLVSLRVLARRSPWDSRVFQRDNNPRRCVPCRADSVSCLS
jgi:hypothetical protein